MRAVLVILCGLGLSGAANAAAPGLPFFDTKELTPYWEQTSALVPAQITSLRAIDQDGQPVSEAAFRRGITLVNFFFADCPNLCPLMMQSMRTLTRTLGPKAEVKVFSFSVQPDRDTPARLRDYARSFGIPPGSWSLVTGERSEIYRFGREIFKADGSVGAQKSESAFIHTRNLYLIDDHGRVRGIYDTGDAKAMALVPEDIRRLKAERALSSPTGGKPAT